MAHIHTVVIFLRQHTQGNKLLGSLCLKVANMLSDVLFYVDVWPSVCSATCQSGGTDWKTHFQICYICASCNLEHDRMTHSLSFPPFLNFSEWPSGSMAAARWFRLIYSLKMLTLQKVSALSLVSLSALFFFHSSKAIPVQVLPLQRLPEGQPEDPRPLCPPQALWQQPLPGSPPPTLTHAPEALQIASEYHGR